jgi:prolyl 3-hydroxylase /prolyl 3,4-dihydroxylase
MELSQWLNPEYLKKKNIHHNEKLFLHQKPFPHLELKNFFQEDKAKLILRALQQESFTLKESDLFKFKQTKDLKSTKNNVLRECYNFLSSPEFIKYMASLSSTKLKPNSIDMAGTLYGDTDFLLPHDDRLEERKIAYLYYVSSLEKSDGGQLNLFSSKNNEHLKIEKQIIPAFNTFAFFLVSPESFHSVEEVVSKKQRYALSGWFHGH